MTRGSHNPPLWKRPKVLALAGAVLAFMLLVVAPPLASALVVQRPLAQPEAIVSLASHEWERLPRAAELAATHPGARVWLTEPPEVSPFNCHDCANRVERLASMGVDRERVEVLPIAHPGTYGEALAVRQHARATGIRRLLVVTSPYHTRRALATFEHAFAGDPVAIGIEPASAFAPFRPSQWLWHGYDRAYVPYEWAATVYYAWRYGVY